MQLCCSRYLNNPYCFYWRSTGLCYANPPFSQLAKVLIKTALEGARVVLCTPKGGSAGKNTFFRRLVDCMTLGFTELPDGRIDVPEAGSEDYACP